MSKEPKVRGTKIADFIAALESGETREAARDVAGCSDATSRIQFAKWNKLKGNTPAKKKTKIDEAMGETKKVNPLEVKAAKKSPLPGVPIPKKAKKKD